MSKEEVIIETRIEGVSEVCAGFQKMGSEAGAMSDDIKDVSKNTESMTSEVRSATSAVQSLGRTSDAIARLGEKFGFLSEQEADALNLFGDIISLGASVVHTLVAIAGSSWTVVIAENARAIAHAIANSMLSWGAFAPTAVAIAAAVAAGLLGYLPQQSESENVPELAGGGVVFHPTLALIGEREAEAVVPLSQITNSPMYSPRTVSVYVTINESRSPRETGDEVIAALRREHVI